MTPWFDKSKIAIGPIGDEQRRAIDTTLAHLIAQHRHAPPPPLLRRCRPPLVKRKREASPEQIARLRELARRSHEAAIARKQEAANGAGKIEVRFREADAAGATSGLASAVAASPAPG
jgi:hypothetical protein